ncbi:hypothetical protein ACRVX5_03065 [Clostridioides difficile]|uniref:hypothetical protein n=1 Tax=Clostridioides sp. ES-S-0001-02 TaxID=2770770 RepID=UPI000BB170E2|nr:hypothetical protein [Clostridioides sp. ES-S-0001-02]MDN9157799.1 hypothetical protein [Clostridioides difficile]MDO0129811.1 hypothetical protein [Clostridioides difficile]PBH84495.1 hypothetical protein BGU59_09945 [Clostridioides difficile]VHU61365.1 Uncharacterised protein [Clostridioides difficile]
MLLANKDKIIQLASKIVELYNVEDLEATIKAIQYLEKVEVNGVIQEEEYNKLLSLIKNEERELTIWKRE